MEPETRNVAEGVASTMDTSPNGSSRTSGQSEANSVEALSPAPPTEAPQPPSSNADASAISDLDEQIDPFRARCLSVGNRYGLSEREIDVLALLARGYSSARIQAELYIAAGTVNYHTRNIYAKLGVHSKQEVIDLVAGDRD